MAATMATVAVTKTMTTRKTATKKARTEDDERTTMIRAIDDDQDE